MFQGRGEEKKKSKGVLLLSNFRIQQQYNKIFPSLTVFILMHFWRCGGKLRSERSVQLEIFNFHKVEVLGSCGVLKPEANV